MFKILAASVIGASAALSPHTAGDNQQHMDDIQAKSGVKCFTSGLCVEAIKAGPRSADSVSPKPGTQCEVHYTGTLIDGTKFDSSRDRGETIRFAPNQVIKGWTEAMQYMVEGDRWLMHIPADLGYGGRGAGGQIPGGATLVFDMEMIKIHGATQETRLEAADYEILSSESGQEL